MAESALTTKPGTGTQTATQSPQSVTNQANSAAATSGEVQPGTAASVLTASRGGIVLQDTPLTTVNLGATTSTTSSSRPPVVLPTQHHFNPLLVGVVILLCAVTLVFFWTTARSAKNTTDYS